MHNTWWRGGAREHAALRWHYHHLHQANQDDEDTPGLHQGAEDDSVSMVLPTHSLSDSFVVVAFGNRSVDRPSSWHREEWRRGAEGTPPMSASSNWGSEDATVFREDGDTKLARMMPVVFFIKPVP